MTEKLALFEANKNAISWQKMAVDAIHNCPKIKKDREKEILAARFGIGESVKTLQAIGNKHNITRERIRQIVNNSIVKIKKNCTPTDMKNLNKEIEKAVISNGGYASSAFLANLFCDESEAEKNGLNFVINLSQNLENVKISSTLHEGWKTKSTKLSELKEISTKACSVLKKSGKIMSLADIAKAIGSKEGITLAAISANKNIMKTDTDHWGLTKWPHVNPRSIRDKSKYIMTRHGKPIHYSKLAQEISNLGTKNVTKQSVHNELIKNEDFVLVGRGIYALASWGYEPGIVEEVIVTVLMEAGEPLHKEVILERVLERRLVKPSTIVLNLQRPRFKKVGKAVYTLN